MIQKALLGDVVLNDYLDFNTLDYDDSNLYQVAYGGGKNSTAMIIKLIQLKAPIDVIIMSDTKAEMPETYEYLPIFKKWLSENAPHIPFHIVIEKDGLTEASFKKKKLPIIARRWCTKDYKIAPMRRLLRSIMREKNKKTVVSYVGIHYHESHRMKPADVLYVKHCYPLVDLKLKEADCIEIIKKAGLPIPVKSGCFYCPFQSKAKWVL